MFTNDAAQRNSLAAFDLQLFADPSAEPAAAEPPAEPSAEPTAQPPAEPAAQSPAEPSQEPPQEPAKPDEPVDLFADYKPTMPEGFVVDNDLMGEFIPVAKELGLKPEQADKLVGVGCKLTQSISTKIVADINNQCETGYQKFVDDSKAANKDFEKEVGQVNALLQHYGDEHTPEQFHAAMVALSGFAPDAVKPLFDALTKMGKDFADPNFKMGQPAPQTPQTLAERLYGGK